MTYINLPTIYQPSLNTFIIKVLLFGHKTQGLCFDIFQIQNLHGINSSEKYWIIQIMLIFMVVMIFHSVHVITHQYFGKNEKNEYICFYRSLDMFYIA